MTARVMRNRRRADWTRACALLSTLWVAAGCGGSDSDPSTPDAAVATDAGSPTEPADGAVDGAVEEDGGSNDDAGSEPGSDGGPTSPDSGPSFSCDACAFGCDASGSACRPPAFSNVAAEVTDGATAALRIEPGAEIELDTDTGAMGGLRSAGAGIRDGIGFFPGSGSMPSVLTVRTLTVREGARLRLRGSRALAIFATGDVVIDGTVDASGGCRGGAAFCGGPGGGQGGHREGTAVIAALGCGPGAVGSASASRTDLGLRYFSCRGGSGGGFGQPGARGAMPDSSDADGAPGGTVEACGDDTLSPLVGGSGGGAAMVGGAGGGGGGALQIASRSRVTIGRGAEVLASGVGGEGGGYVNHFPGRRETFPVGGGGGGGGSGGGILIEAPIVEIAASAVIAANGGAGGGSSTRGTVLYHGEDGRPSDEPALGGMPGRDCENDTCGDGGDGGSLLGLPRVGNYGGGGGGAGRIRIRATTVGLSIDADAVISPAYTTGLLGPT